MTPVMGEARHEPGSAWYQRGKRKGLRSQPRFWQTLKSQGKCVTCWKPRDGESQSQCRLCLHRAKLRARKARGWDGTTEWKPKRLGRAPRRSVSCTLPLAAYEQLLALAGRDGIPVGTIAREAIESYLGDVCEG